MRLLSIFDFTGNWASPYKQAGWEVVLIDIKHQDGHKDKLNWDIANTTLAQVESLGPFDGVLAALPCTDFAASGARWWADKDKDGRTKKSVQLAQRTLEIINFISPSFWALENPVGRLHKLLPEIGRPAMYFNPCDYGDPYTKKTALYGSFNTNLIKNPVPPTEGSKMWRLYGGKSERTKQARSQTPMGFAAAFFQANNLK